MIFFALLSFNFTSTTVKGHPPNIYQARMIIRISIKTKGLIHPTQIEANKLIMTIMSQKTCPAIIIFKLFIKSGFFNFISGNIEKIYVASVVVNKEKNN